MEKTAYKRIYDSEEIVVDYRNGTIRISVFEDGHWKDEHFVEGVELVVHAHWEDVYGGKYANPRYRCSRCKRKAMYRMEQDVLLSWKEVQELTPRCPYAHYEF